MGHIYFKMRTNYRRFRELLSKANTQLKYYGENRDGLFHAVKELSFLIESETPESAWENLKEIKTQLTRIKPKGNEGSYKATIDTLSENEVKSFILKVKCLG